MKQENQVTPSTTNTAARELQHKFAFRHPAETDEQWAASQNYVKGWNAAVDATLTQQQGGEEVACCACGKPVDTRENDTPGSELTDGRWVCSGDCWDDLAAMLPPLPKECDEVFAADASGYDWLTPGKCYYTPDQMRAYATATLRTKQPAASEGDVDWAKFPYSDAWCDGLSATLWECGMPNAQRQVEEIKDFVRVARANTSKQAAGDVLSEGNNDRLVSMTITVGKDRNVQSDVETHGNSYADVTIGLGIVREEILRVFAEQKDCPFYPTSREDAHKKIQRTEVQLAVERALIDKNPALRSKQAAGEAVDHATAMEG